MRKQWLRDGRVPADYPEPVAADYPVLLGIVEEKVKPERLRNKRKIRRERWWQYAERAPKLYANINGMEGVLACSEVTHQLSFGAVPTNRVFTANLDVLPVPEALRPAYFCCMQSRLHEAWARAYSSDLRTFLKYSPGNAFETFPFPNQLADLEAIGERYYAHRQQIMHARQEGLTKTYNRFHDPAETGADIAELRALHVEMDQAVAAAYGWTDLSLSHGFHDTKQGLRYTLSEPARREVLDRLLRLNHERYAEEVAAGLHDKAAGRRPRPAAGKPSGRSKRSPDKAPIVRDLFSQEQTT